MPHRRLAAVVAAALLVTSSLSVPARAENQMGYQLLSAQEASGLPHNHGALGMDVARAQQISDAGLTFNLFRVKLVRPGSPAARGGLNAGDQIIAVDGRVFPSVVAFASYVGSKPAGTSINVDYIPAGGGPAQAQRVALVMAMGAGAAQAANPPAQTGMSTETKVAIGVGAVALLGCYEMGCFNRRRGVQPAQQQQYQQQQYQQQPGMQQSQPNGFQPR